jgi:hypothetical protein
MTLGCGMRCYAASLEVSLLPTTATLGSGMSWREFLIIVLLLQGAKWKRESDLALLHLITGWTYSSYVSRLE